ncbi:hypothetical protein PENARI_c012G07984 [Penicillium arizonense]|uniref:Uncharacterized protein n=1 Tax=Penicillium arizonense TaxID=1835702 RepID=A0A1F5LEI7_PENAI|nr:hypothetical protein PENARI_c012G07984 [Penicillium arizonense]OGE51628.1 hypothetical protein PENARI_c012G07984 [Penicillium arizonense]
MPMPTPFDSLPSTSTLSCTRFGYEGNSVGEHVLPRQTLVQGPEFNPREIINWVNVFLSPQDITYNDETLMLTVATCIRTGVPGDHYTNKASIFAAADLQADWYRQEIRLRKSYNSVQIPAPNPPGVAEKPSEQVKPALGTSNAGPVPGFSESPSSSSDDRDIWARAYKLLQDREPKLTEDYTKHLGSMRHNKPADANLSIPKLLQQVVKLLLEEREKKQWRVSLPGKDVKIREQVEKLTKFLLWADPVVQKAVSTQPYAALAWAGVSLLLPLLSSGTTSNIAMLKGFNSIDDVLIYWDLCRRNYICSKHREEYQELMEPLAKLYSHILEYQARSICHLSKAQLSRAWENMADGGYWDSMTTEIERLSKTCSSYIHPLEAEEIRKNRDSLLQEMRESRNNLDKIRMILEANGVQTQRNYEDEKERELLQSLASGYEDDKNFNPKRVQHTCEWFFQDNQLRNWRDSETSRLLWISAGPGCGKSVLSRALIDEDRLSTNITTSTICYFFFKDGDEHRMSATNALRAILHQLFTHHPTNALLQYGTSSHRKNGENLTTNFSELWRLLIQCANSREAGEIVCVLDALDECKKKDWEQLIDKLREFYSPSGHSSSSKLKFLITSRPYDDLMASFNKLREASFNKLRDTDTYLRFDGGVKHAEDIDLFIDAKVNQIARHFQERDRQMISKHLKGMENRTYLWLHLTFDIIEQSPSQYGRRSDVEALLSGLPSKVSDAYEKILDRSQDEIKTATLLQLVLAAARPLTLDEANIALTMALKEKFSSYAELKESLWPDGDFENIVKNLCGLFISVYDGKLFFIHQTARNFLLESPEGKWKGQFNMTRSHMKMALLCLSYLSYLDEQRPIEEIRSNFPLAQYCASYLLVHARPAETEKDVMDALSKFFFERGQAYTAWGKLFDPDRPWHDEPFRCHPMATPFYYASLAGLQRTVRLFAENGAGVSAQGGRFGNALQAASSEGHKEVVQLLLEKGAEINAQDGYHGTALQAASYGGYQEIVQLLLDQGAEVNCQGGHYGNALQAALASSRGYKEIVQLLLEKGAKINPQGGFYGNALQAASYRGYQEIVQLLLDNGAEINYQGGHYGNALQGASSGGHKEIMQLLLDKGAEVNSQGGRSGNTLQAASLKGHKELVQLLLDKGAKVNTQSGRLGNALQAASIGGHKELVQLLLDKGAEINAQSGYLRNALQAASFTGHKEVMQLLLDNGAKINYQGGYYGNALQAASSRGHKEVVQLLLDNGAEINYQGGHYGNALQAASFKGHKEVVQLLLDNGAEINCQGGHCRNALRAASSKGYKEVVQLLLDKGAEVNAHGGYYDNALEAASTGGHKEIEQLLLGKGAGFKN